MVTLVSETTTGFDAALNDTVYIIEANVVVGNTTDAFEFANFDGITLLVEGIVASDTGVGIEVLSGSVNSQIIVTSSATVTGSNGVFMAGDGQSIVNDGRIFGDTVGVSMLLAGSLENTGAISVPMTSAANFAVRVGGTTTGENSVISNTGTISGGSAIRLDSGATGSEIFNDGTLSALNYGMDIQAVDVEVYNTGTVQGANQGVAFNGGSGLLVNSGTIEADLRGVYFGLNTPDDESVTLVNSGEILALEDGVVANSGVLDLSNTGVISGGNSGVEVDADTTLNLVNAGQITGLDVAAVLGGDLADTVNNSGGIVGDVDMGDGVDLIGNSGGIIGDVTMDSGTDVILNSGDIIGDVDLGSDADIFVGANGAVTGTIEGGGGQDRLVLGEGSDEAYGGADGDFIQGNAGEDQIYGDDDSDVLLGGAGDDLIFGGAAGDVLFGGDGIDVIYGGAGADILYGDTGSDFFTFTDAGDSVSGSRDVIADFEVGVDFIDIFALEDDLVFIGTSGFSGTGGAEVRVTTAGGPNSTVRVDLNGDGGSDFEILLLNATGLTAAEFGL